MGCASSKAVAPDEDANASPAAADAVPAAQMHDVMVSYSHADATFTRTLVIALRDAGLSVWIDEEALTGGVRSLEAIGKAVCECRCVLPVLSSKRVESKWCTDELGLAYSNRKMLFPVTCEPFEQIKLSYACLLYTSPSPRD